MEKQLFLIKVYDTKEGQVSVHELTTEEGLHTDNANAIWNVEFDFFGQQFQVTGEHFLSGAMDKIRAMIEPKGYRVLVKCADYDAAHSGMQADMSGGSKIYKLNLLDELRKQPDAKGNPAIEASFHVFDESDIASVTTLEKQKEFRAEYFNNNNNKKR